MKLHQLQKRQQAKAQRALRFAMGDLIVFSRDRKDVTFTPRADFYIDRFGVLVIPYSSAIIRDGERFQASYTVPAGRWRARSRRAKLRAVDLGTDDE